MPNGQYDAHPVLPGESKSLPTHVENCALRYNALVRTLGKLRIEMRLCMLVNAGLLFICGWMLNKLLEKVP